MNYRAKFLRKSLSLFSPLFFIFPLVSCDTGKGHIYKKSEFLMDTIVTVTVVAESKKRAESSINKTFKELQGLEGLLNFFSPRSEISKINQNAGIKDTKVPPETFRLIEKAVDVSSKTDGAFDITIGVIMKMYDFHKKTRPPDNSIKEKLPLIGYKKIALDQNKLTIFLKKKGMLIDTGGITKGFAADWAIEILKSEGIKAALVALSGDIRGYGVKPDGKPWKIGIRDPRGQGPEDIIATFDLKDRAISTSGDYERFFIEDGKRYHHIMDPETGYPARGVISVTVIGPLAVYTDSLATALFISRKGLEIAKTLGYSALIFDEKGKIYITDSIRGKVEFIKRDTSLYNHL